MSIFKKGASQSRLIFSVGLVTLLLVIGILSYDNKIESVTADTQPNMSGWAWSDNIGWISFSWLNGGPGPVYGVSVAGQTTGDLNGLFSGYAWSDNIGWISFQCNATSGSGECFAPGESYLNSGSGYQGPARVDNNILKGWVRACSVFATGCSGALKSDDARGGWDGWISLSGTSTGGGTYGVTYFPGSTAGAGTFGRFGDNAHSFAWGDTNLGWISFQPRDPSSPDCLANPSRCGVILGQPEFSAYCTVEDDGQSPAHATWRAYPSGGTGHYTYKWTFQPNGASCSPGSDSGFTGVSPFSTSCATTGAGSTGTVDATVAVNDGSGGTPLSSMVCSNVNGGHGVTVRVPEPSFSIDTRSSISAIFQGGEKATTTPVATVTVTPTISPVFAEQVTLSVDIPDETIASLGIAASDIVPQFSQSTTGPVSGWSFSSTATVGPATGYSPVSLFLYFKNRPVVSSFTVTVKGIGGGLTRSSQPITINIDKGTSGVQEQ